VAGNSYCVETLSKGASAVKLKPLIVAACDGPPLIENSTSAFLSTVPVTVTGDWLVAMLSAGEPLAILWR